MQFLLGFGWVLFAALYLTGLAYFIATDAAQWRRQGIPFSWRMISGRKFAWPITMLSDTMTALGR